MTSVWKHIAGRTVRSNVKGNGRAKQTEGSSMQIVHKKCTFSTCHARVVRKKTFLLCIKYFSPGYISGDLFNK